MELTFSLAHIQTAAARFLQQVPAQACIAFYGAMGAGKTTFVTALCQELGVADKVNSPTFTLVNEYCAADGRPVYHFDFYRIKRLEEAYDMGFEEYLQAPGLCLIEWPELVEELLPADCLKVQLLPLDAFTRKLVW